MPKSKEAYRTDIQKLKAFYDQLYQQNVRLRTRFVEHRQASRRASEQDSLLHRLARLGLTSQDLFNLSNLQYRDKVDSEVVVRFAAQVAGARAELGPGPLSKAELHLRLQEQV